MLGQLPCRTSNGAKPAQKVATQEEGYVTPLMAQTSSLGALRHS